MHLLHDCMFPHFLQAFDVLLQMDVTYFVYLLHDNTRSGVAAEGQEDIGAEIAGYAYHVDHHSYHVNSNAIYDEHFGQGNATFIMLNVIHYNFH